MVGPFLTEAIILFVFCSTFGNGKDLLEVFRPSPDLPQELNEWLASVQKHKSDFRIIREVAASHREGVGFDGDDEDDDFSRKDFTLHIKDDIIDQDDSLDDRPKNDIYPHMYKNKPSHLLDYDSYNYRPHNKNKRFSSKSMESPIRFRRDLDDINIFNHHNVNIEPRSKTGEIKRSDNKYPERYSNSLENFSANKNNIKNIADISNTNMQKKREIQIDIKNDGKLVKQILEDTKDPKSIVLNIQSQNEEKSNSIINPNILSNNPNIQSNLNNNLDNKISVPVLNPQSINALPINKHEIPSAINTNFENSQKEKEVASNFNNLFTVNEHLNTDSNLAHLNANNEQLIYHVTIPDINSLSEETYSYIPQFPNAENLLNIKKVNPPIQMDTNIQNFKSNNFNHNNLEDMSKFWTASEKSKMEKGIEIARMNNNLHKVPQSIFQQNNQQTTDSGNGFEPAQRIELDNAFRQESSNKNENNKDVAETNKKDSKNTRNAASDIWKSQNKRQLEALEGQIEVINENNFEKSLRSIDNITLENANSINLSNNEGLQNKEKLEEVDIKSNQLDSNDIETLDKTTPSIVIIDALSGNKIMEGNVESVVFDDLSKNNAKDIPVNENNLLNESITTLELNNKDLYKGIDANTEENKGDLLEENNLISNENPINEKFEKIEIIEDISPSSSNEINNGKLNDEKNNQEIETLEHTTTYEENGFHKHKHIKTRIRKLHKHIKDEKTITESEIITEIEPDVEEDVVHSLNAQHSHLNTNNLLNEEPKTEDKIEEEKGGAVVEEKNENHNKENQELQTENSVVELAPSNSHKHHEHKSSEDNILPIKESDANGKVNKDHSHKHKENTIHRGIKIITKPFKQYVKKRREKFSPFHKKIVLVHNNPYKNLRYNIRQYDFKKPRFINHENEDTNLFDDYIDDVPKQLDFSYSEKDSKQRSYCDNGLNSIVHSNLKNGKGSSEDQTSDEKQNKKMHHKKNHKKFNRFNPNNLDYNTYEDAIDSGNYVNVYDNNDHSSESDFIPAFVGRQLKSAEYEYGAYFDKTARDYYDDISTESKKLISKHDDDSIQMLHKDSVEGDYGDEEDSITEKHKANTFNIIKKSENEFANPVTTSEKEDDYYNENYDNGEYYSNEKVDRLKENSNKKSSINAESVKIVETTKRNQALRAKIPPVMKNNDLENFSHHLHKKYKPKPKIKEKQPVSVQQKQNKEKLKEKSKNNEKKDKIRGKENFVLGKKKITNSKFFDARSDFDHWPSFVINNDENEEKLRKRSLVARKQMSSGYKFPLASNDFFVKPEKKKKSVEVKRDKPNDKSSFIGEDKVLDMDKPLFTTDQPPLLSEGDTLLMSNEPTNVAGKEVTASVNSEVGDDDSCTEHKAKISNVCEENENFNKTVAEMTTILAIIPESQSESIENGTYHEAYEKLDDILNGQLPLKLLNDVFNHVKQNKKLKNRFHKGLKKTHRNINFHSLNSSNGIETRRLLESMTSLMNQLQITTTCQTLQPNLVNYLKSLTKVPKEDALAKAKEMEEVEFDDSQNERNFIFESSPHGGGDNLQGKVQVLNDLLSKFNNLPDRCKSRAEPVKEYIENHLGMLNNMLSGSETQSNPQKSLESRSDDFVKDEDTLIQEQLDSLGLGKEHNFKPKFNLDEMIENRRNEKAVSISEKSTTKRPKNVNVIKRDLQLSRTKKYNKLLDAVQKVRLRRDGERRIGEMFGNAGHDRYNSMNSGYKKTKDSSSNVNFESPLVYSL